MDSKPEADSAWVLNEITQAVPNALPPTWAAIDGVAHSARCFDEQFESGKHDQNFRHGDSDCATTGVHAGIERHTAEGTVSAGCLCVENAPSTSHVHGGSAGVCATTCDVSACAGDVCGCGSVIAYLSVTGTQRHPDEQPDCVSHASSITPISCKSVDLGSLLWWSRSTC